MAGIDCLFSIHVCRNL